MDGWMKRTNVAPSILSPQAPPLPPKNKYIHEMAHGFVQLHSSTGLSVASTPLSPSPST